MTQEKLTNAITGLDADILDRYFTMKQALAAKKKAKVPTWVKWSSLAAACLVLLILAIPKEKPLHNIPEDFAPLSRSYASIEEAHKALGKSTLYSKITLDTLNPSDISIVYDFVTGDIALDNNVEVDAFSGMASVPNLEQLKIPKPRQLAIHTAYDNGKTIDMVDFYILFNQNSIDDSRIGGYVEQGLTKEINGITVHYCLIEDGAMHSHAKFLYEGNLYVIDVKSYGDIFTLDTYLDMILN